MREKLDVSSAVSVEESELEQMSVTGYLPPGDIVLQGPVSGYFCGEKRCTSPFAQNKPMRSPSDASLLRCMEANCRELSLKAHFLHQLPDISMIAAKLTVLNLSFNMLKVLPPSLFTAVRLEELYLRNNPLVLISEEIRNFTLLRIFSASFCLLEELPLSVYTLHRLRELDLSYNRIKRISHRIGSLRELFTLNLDGNELPGLPPQILCLEELKHLKITNNYMHPFIWNDYLNAQPDHLQDMCLSAVLRELFDGDVERVPAYLKGLYTQRTQQCSNCDLIYLGRGREIILASSTPVHSMNSFPILYGLCADRCVPYLQEKLGQH